MTQQEGEKRECLIFKMVVLLTGGNPSANSVRQSLMYIYKPLSIQTCTPKNQPA